MARKSNKSTQKIGERLATIRIVKRNADELEFQEVPTQPAKRPGRDDPQTDAPEFHERDTTPEGAPSGTDSAARHKISPQPDLGIQQIDPDADKLGTGEFMRYASFQLSAGVDLTEETRSLIDELEAEAEASSDPTQRASYFCEAGRLWERALSDPGRALDCFRKAIAADLQSEDATAGLVRAGLRLGAGDEVARHLGLAAAEAEGRARCALLAQQALVLETGQRDLESARACYEKIAEAAPDDVFAALSRLLLEGRPRGEEPASGSLTRLADCVEDSELQSTLLAWHASHALNEGESSAELVRRAQAAIEADPRIPQAHALLRKGLRDDKRHAELAAALSADPNVDRATRHYWSARVAYFGLDDPQAARTELQMALEEDPDCAPAMQLLTTVYERTGELEEKRQLLSRQAGSRPDRQGRFALYHEAGVLHELQGEDDAAVEQYRRALEMCPTYLRSLGRLGKIYSRDERWEDLVRMHRSEAQNTTDTTLQAIAYRRMGDVLHDKLERMDDAIDAYERAMRLDPSDELCMRALERLYGESNRWSDIVGLYESRLESTDDAAERASLLESIAIVAEHRLSNVAGAINALRRVPPGAPRGLSLLQLRARLFERAGCWEDLVETLLEESELLENSARKASLLVWAGSILDRQLDRPEEAFGHYEAASVVDRSYLPAWLALGRAHARKGDHQAVLDAYINQLPHVAPAERTAVRCRIGELLVDSLGKPALAMVHFKLAYEDDPTYMPAVHGLFRCATELQDVEQLIRVLAGEAERGPDPHSRAVLRYQQAELLWESDPDPTRALDVLVRIMREYGHLWQPRELLVEIAQLNVRHDTVADVLAREAHRLEEHGHRIRLLLVLAEYQWKVLGSPAGAAKAFREVLGVTEHEPRALLGLLLLCMEHGDLAGTVNALGRLAESVTQPALRRALLLRLALGREGLGGSSEEILACYREAMELDPSDSLAREAVKRLALVRGDMELLAWTLEQELQAGGPDHPDRPAVITALAQTYNTLERREESLALLTALVETEQPYLPALKLLKRMLLATGEEGARLARILEQDCRLSRVKEVQSGNLLLLAQDAVDRRQDVAAACDLLEAALRLDADAMEVVDKLLGLYESQDREALPTATLERILDAARDAEVDPEALSLFCTRLARSYPRDPEGVPRRLSLLNEAVRYTPEKPDLLLDLGDIYEQSGLFMEATAVYSRLVAGDLDPVLLKETHLRLAILWGDQLGDSPRARVHLGLAIDQDPSDRTLRMQYIELLQDEHDWHTMAEQLQEVVAHATSAAERSAALVELAAVLRTRLDQTDEARAVLRRLLTEDPGAVPDPDALAEELAQTEDWEGLYKAYLVIAEDPDLARAVPARIGLARLCVERLDRPDEAVEQIDAVLRLAPDDASLRAQCAAILVEVEGQQAEAVAQLSRAVALSGASEPLLEQLRALYVRLQRPRRAAVVSLVLGNDAATLSSDVTPPRAVGHLPPEAARHPDQVGIVQELVTLLAPHLGQIYPPELDSYEGLASVSSKEPGDYVGLIELAEALGEALGQQRFRLYVADAVDKGLAVELTDPFSIIVDRVLAEASPERVRFELAYSLALAAQSALIAHRGLAVQPSPRELAVLLAAAARPVVPGFGTRLTAPAVLDGLAAQLEEGLPMDARAALGPVVQRYAASPGPDHRAWLRAARQTAVRSAVILADDLPATLRHLSKSLAPQDFAELASFLTSESYFALVFPA